MLHRHRLLSLATVALLIGGCASTPPAAAPQTLQLPSDGRVDVSWADPAGFREHRCLSELLGERGVWVRTLAEYTRKEAERMLPANARMSVHFVDIDRAGECEPRRDGGGDLRVVRDMFPPRISLRYGVSGTGNDTPDGTEAKLVDGGFMLGGPNITDSDPLRYEKKLIRDWLRKRFETR